MNSRVDKKNDKRKMTARKHSAQRQHDGDSNGFQFKGTELSLNNANVYDELVRLLVPFVYLCFNNHGSTPPTQTQNNAFPLEPTQTKPTQPNSLPGAETADTKHSLRKWNEMDGVERKEVVRCKLKNRVNGTKKFKFAGSLLLCCKVKLCATNALKIHRCNLINLLYRVR